jgi:hypothetical protein
MDVTDDERSFGFGRLVIAGEERIAMQLAVGLYAVKRETSAGVEYTITNGELHVLYSPAKSIDELRARFNR